MYSRTAKSIEAGKQQTTHKYTVIVMIHAVPWQELRRMFQVRALPRIYYTRTLSTFAGRIFFVHSRICTHSAVRRFLETYTATQKAGVWC